MRAAGISRESSVPCSFVAELDLSWPKTPLQINIRFLYLTAATLDVTAAFGCLGLPCFIRGDVKIQLNKASWYLAGNNTESQTNINTQWTVPTDLGKPAVGKEWGKARSQMFNFLSLAIAEPVVLPGYSMAAMV